MKSKVAGFYAARSRTIPPLPWPTFAPPFSVKTSNKQTTGYHVEFSARRTEVDAEGNSAVIPVKYRTTFWSCNARVMCPRFEIAVLIVFRCYRKGTRASSFSVHDYFVRTASWAGPVPLIDGNRN